MYKKIGKRILDLIITVPILVFLVPYLGIIALTIIFQLDLGSPIFRQKRPGLNGKPFTICKFRTMTNQRDKDGNMLKDAERLSSLGILLRRLSLDELPSLYNVIKGEMSLVGPRPLMMEYIDRYNTQQARRHEIKPGITGWAQINGRNTIQWGEKFELDVWYVDNMSFWLDIRILGVSILKILKREGINQEGEATVREFLGKE